MLFQDHYDTRQRVTGDRLVAHTHAGIHNRELGMPKCDAIALSKYLLVRRLRLTVCFDSTHPVCRIFPAWPRDPGSSPSSRQRWSRKTPAPWGAVACSRRRRPAGGGIGRSRDRTALFEAAVRREMERIEEVIHGPAELGEQRDGAVDNACLSPPRDQCRRADRYRRRFRSSFAAAKVNERINPIGTAKLGMTFAFRDPQCEHTHRRRVAICGNGVSSGRPISSKVVTDPR